VGDRHQAAWGEFGSWAEQALNPDLLQEPLTPQKNRGEMGRPQSKQGVLEGGVEVTILLLLGAHSRSVQLLLSETQQTHSSSGMGYPGPGSAAGFLLGNLDPPGSLSLLGWAWPSVDGAMLVLASAQPPWSTPSLVQSEAFPSHRLMRVSPQREAGLG